MAPPIISTGLGDWSMAHPSEVGREAVARAAVLYMGAPRLDSALHAAMMVGRTSLRAVYAAEIRPQEWVDLMWVIAAWMIARHPTETLHFRLYQHLRFELGVAPEYATEMLRDVLSPEDDYDLLRQVTK